MMYKLLSLSIICYYIAIFFSSCASIVPPTGGPKDTIPPVLVSSNPADSSLLFKGNKIELLFNEYVQVKDISKHLIVSPSIKTMPTVSHYLNKITLKLKDSLQANTTYTFNFGNSIADVNEGNPYKNYTYVISTGDHLDMETMRGKALLAETGTVDSTLLAVLYQDLSDTVVYKNSPQYVSRIDGAGNFEFKHLPKNKAFQIFVVENSFMKNYSDSTKLFAFLPQPIVAGNTDSATIQLYAYRAAEPKPKIQEKRLSLEEMEKLKKAELKITAQLEPNNLQSILKQLPLISNKPIRNIDSKQCKLLENGKPQTAFSIQKDSTDPAQKQLILQTQWIENTQYELILQPSAVTDTFGITLQNADTIRFNTKKESDYAQVILIFPDVQLEKNPVVQLINNHVIEDAIAIPSDRKIYRKLYTPGDYKIRILYDENKNLRWDKGNYRTKQQPEIVIDHKKEITLKANWENEIEIYLYQ